MAASQAILLLQKQLRGQPKKQLFNWASVFRVKVLIFDNFLIDFPDLCKNPVDGFSAGLVDETDMFEWSVSIIGPPDTL
jgi:hypothetical protein